MPPTVTPSSQKTNAILDKTETISAILLDQSIALISSKFGADYAKTNPHVLSNVLNTHRSVYLSLQEK